VAEETILALKPGKAKTLATCMLSEMLELDIWLRPLLLGQGWGQNFVFDASMASEHCDA